MKTKLKSDVVHLSKYPTKPTTKMNFSPETECTEKEFSGTVSAS